MLLTEDQAAQTWCPMSAPSQAVRPGEPNPARCVAKHCAAWRWADPGMDNPRQPDSYIADGLQAQRGYCGLAGRPINLD